MLVNAFLANTFLDEPPSAIILLSLEAHEKICIVITLLTCRMDHKKIEYYRLLNHSTFENILLKSCFEKCFQERIGSKIIDS